MYLTQYKIPAITLGVAALASLLSGHLLQTKVGKAVYAARKCVVEPVFGQIKQARGFRQFLLRGKEKVKGECALLCLTHNLLRLHAAMQYY